MIHNNFCFYGLHLLTNLLNFNTNFWKNFDSSIYPFLYIFFVCFIKFSQFLHFTWLIYSRQQFWCKVILLHFCNLWFLVLVIFLNDFWLLFEWDRLFSTSFAWRNVLRHEFKLIFHSNWSLVLFNFVNNLFILRLIFVINIVLSLPLFIYIVLNKLFQLFILCRFFFLHKVLKFLFRFFSAQLFRLDTNNWFIKNIIFLFFWSWR